MGGRTMQRRKKIILPCGENYSLFALLIAVIQFPNNDYIQVSKGHPQVNMQRTRLLLHKGTISRELHAKMLEQIRERSETVVRSTDQCEGRTACGKPFLDITELK